MANGSMVTNNPGRFLMTNACTCFFPLFCLSGALVAAPPSIQTISPRGAQRGQTVTLILEGANLTADAELVTRLSSVSWVVSDDPNLKPAPNKMAFRLSLNPNEAQIGRASCRERV